MIQQTEIKEHVKFVFPISEQAQIGQSTVKSEFHQIYKSLINPNSIDSQNFIQKFNKNEINYDPNSPYQAFHFTVEKMVPNTSFYRIKIYIAHFTLTATSSKVFSSNPIQRMEDSSGAYGQIYFANMNGKSLCIKSFRIIAQNQFQSLFAKVVKEWTVLKISSVLQCGPYIENYLGFDIIIYDDCIQFVTEEGKPLLKITQKQVYILKAQLALMHGFKIIHLDIKPENIIFSSHFAKPVFIDFGFSEIINEKIGVKSLTEFKGTLNFCTREMFALMGEKQNYIDLYYNDAYALEMIFKQKLNLGLVSFIYAEDEPHHSKHHSAVILLSQYEVEKNFIFLAFQFHYLNHDQSNAKKLLKKYLEKSIRNVKNVFSFMKLVLNYTFLPNLLYDSLKVYEHTAEHQQIEYLNRINGELFFVKDSAKDEEEINSDKKQKLQPLSFINSEFEHPHNYEQYFTIIININNLDNENLQPLVAAALQCVRFDVKNMQTKDKALIAKKLNLLLIDYIGVSRDSLNKKSALGQTVEEQQVRQIMVLLQLILEICLRFNPCRWVKSHIFEVFQQLILVDVDLSQYIDRVLLAITANFQSIHEKVETVFNCDLMLQTAEFVLTEHIQSIELVFNKLQKFVQAWPSIFQGLTSDELNSQVLSISRILNLLKNTETTSGYQFECMEEELKNVKNTKIKNYLLYYITNKKLEYHFDCANTEQILKIVEFVKRSMQLKSQNFIISAKLILKIIHFTSNSFAFISYSNYISDIINCPFIFSQLKFNGFAQIIKTKYACPVQRLQKFAKLYPYLRKTEKMIEIELLGILLQFSRNIKVMSLQLKEKIIQMYQVYQRQNQDKYNYNDVKMFYLAFFRSRLQFYFYQISPQTQTAFTRNLKKGLHSIQLLPNDQYQSIKGKFLQYKIAIYLSQQKIADEQYFQCFNQLIQAAQICLSIKANYLTFEILTMLNRISWRYEDEEIIKRHTIKLYSFCKSTHYISYYFLQTTKINLFATILVLARTNRGMFHQFMLKLTQFLCEHPVESYFLTLMENLDKFLKSDPSNGSSIHYSFFGSTNLKSNPYLLIFYSYSLRNELPDMQLKLFKIIALNLNNLSEFAKRKLLEKYLSVYLLYIEGRTKRQKIFIFKSAIKYLHSFDKQRHGKKLLRISTKFPSGHSIYYRSLKTKIEALIKVISKK